jgi:hypothetical protein
MIQGRAALCNFGQPCVTLMKLGANPYGCRMSLNVERTRELLRALRDEDPHAAARRRLISAQADQTSTRAQAIALLSVELLRDPHDLVTHDPPSWLVDLSRLSQPGTTLLFDSRVTDLAARAVDDLVAQGLSIELLVDWLEDRRRDSWPAQPDPDDLAGAR